jgi:hypothetical protein
MRSRRVAAAESRPRPILHRARRHRDSNERTLALGIQDEPLQRRRTGKLPVVAHAVLQPVEPVDVRPSALRPARQHPELVVVRAEGEAVDAAVEHALHAGRRNRLARGDHAVIGHASRRRRRLCREDRRAESNASESKRESRVHLFLPGGFAPPDPPSPSLAGAPMPRSAPAGAPLARSHSFTGLRTRTAPPAASCADRRSSR